MMSDAVTIDYYRDGLVGLRSLYYRHRIISAATYRACRASFLDDLVRLRLWP